MRTSGSVVFMIQRVESQKENGKASVHALQSREAWPRVRSEGLAMEQSQFLCGTQRQNAED